MENFTPVSAAVGGLFIGLAATLALWSNGRIAGISGILSGILHPKGQDVLWRSLFVTGLLCGGAIYVLISGSGLELEPQSTPITTVIAGLLVGFGTRLGSGCNSGHGICGIARFSKRSFLATFTFIFVGVVTVYVFRHVLGVGA